MRPRPGARLRWALSLGLSVATPVAPGVNPGGSLCACALNSEALNPPSHHVSPGAQLGSDLSAVEGTGAPAENGRGERSHLPGFMVYLFGAECIPLVGKCLMAFHFRRGEVSRISRSARFILQASRDTYR